LAGALLLDEKINQSPALFWFGLRNDVILYLRAATQRPIDVSPAFMEYGLRKRSRLEHMQTVNQTSRRIRGLFLHGAAQNFELLSNIQDQK
jgi:hypothetical protein